LHLSIRLAISQVGVSDLQSHAQTTGITERSTDPPGRWCIR